MGRMEIRRIKGMSKPPPKSVARALSSDTTEVETRVAALPKSACPKKRTPHLPYITCGPISQARDRIFWPVATLISPFTPKYGAKLYAPEKVPPLRPVLPPLKPSDLLSNCNRVYPPK